MEINFLSCFKFKICVISALMTTYLLPTQILMLFGTRTILSPSLGLGLQLSTEVVCLQFRIIPFAPGLLQEINSILCTVILISCIECP